MNLPIGLIPLAMGLTQSKYENKSLTQSLIEMSTRRISYGVKAAGAYG